MSGCSGLTGDSGQMLISSTLTLLRSNGSGASFLMWGVGGLGEVSPAVMLLGDGGTLDGL